MHERFDPILLEVMNNELTAVAEEMAITMKRTARSIVAKEGGDFSTALVDAEGRLIAQGIAVGAHLGYIVGVMPWVLKKFSGNLQPGDIIAANDPYWGLSHLPDIVLIMPIFWREELRGFAAVVEHHTDIGGRFPGGMGIACAEIYEEGVRLPGVKFYRAGVANQALLDLIAANVRAPQDVLGDLEAQVAACRRGEQGFVALLQKYGRDTVEACNTELRQYSERAVRSRIQAIPDGIYTCEDVFEDDGLGGPGVKLVVSIHVQGDTVTVDFTGTDPQVKSAINVPPNLIGSMVQVIFRSVLGLDVPANSGLLTPIRTTAPEGCILNPKFPAAVGARGQLMWRIHDMLFAALAQAIPERVFAAGEGGVNMLVYAPTVEAGTPPMLLEMYASGWGGRPTRDGIDGTMPIVMGGAFRSNPAEAIEREIPVMIEGFGFVPDSGGAGRFRGSLAIYRKWRFLTDGRAMIRTCRVKSVPYGLAGGEPGSPFQVLLESDSQPLEFPPQIMIDAAVRAGDRLLHVQPSAGGYGDPWQREPRSVLEDVLDEKMTVAYAKKTYGVVIDPQTRQIDEERTAALRQSRNEHAHGEVGEIRGTVINGETRDAELRQNTPAK
ncbi:MAG TPA: hydantoinase B/oxoprolinase family protein [Candidatus Binatia bacterium]|jgi:N-methylhydantoinase B/oxoprolinase/acetone carboxylase alpha subunit|nr:hydantoinase B/oxoprolinase family protein [Candidatus Binatia bacterium]